jgi:hypothetical protein
MRTLIVAPALGCGGSVDDDVAEECERSAYELERTRYRCTSAGELQTLDCGEWVTLEVCAEPEACSPAPDPGCD